MIWGASTHFSPAELDRATAMPYTAQEHAGFLRGTMFGCALGFLIWGIGFALWGILR